MNKEERSIAVDEAEQVQDGNGVTILDLFNAVRKHVITAVVTLVIVMVAICAYTFTRTPQYTATSEFLATYRSSAAASGASSNASELSSGANYINSQIQTYPQLVKTESVLQPVIDDLGLDTTVKELAESVTASNPDGTMLVDISVNDPDPKQASSIANSVAENLRKQVTSTIYSDEGDKIISPVNLTVVQQAYAPASPVHLTSSSICRQVLRSVSFSASWLPLSRICWTPVFAAILMLPLLSMLPYWGR